MRQQVMNRHLFSDVFAVVRQVVRQLAVQLDLSLFDKLQNDCRRKLFGYGAEAKFRVWRVRNVPLHVRHSKVAFINHLPILRDEHSAVKLPVLVREGEHLLNLRRVVLGERSLLEKNG